MRRNFCIFYVIISFSVSIVDKYRIRHKQKNDAEGLCLMMANEHLLVRMDNTKKQLAIYDDIFLKLSPNNISTLKMKGIAQSNLDDHQ